MKHRPKRYRRRGTLAMTLEERAEEIVEAVPAHSHEAAVKALLFWADVLDMEPVEKREELARIISEAMVLKRKAGEARLAIAEAIRGRFNVRDRICSALDLSGETMLETLDLIPEPGEADIDSYTFDDIVRSLREEAAGPEAMYVLTEEATDE